MQLFMEQLEQIEKCPPYGKIARIKTIDGPRFASLCIASPPIGNSQKLPRIQELKTRNWVSDRGYIYQAVSIPKNSDGVSAGSQRKSRLHEVLIL